jgi:hypothetical protein
MKSAITDKNYDTVYFVHSDTQSFLLESLEGASFQELEDSTWLCISGEHAGTVRYKGSIYHGTGIALSPIYELVDGNWFWILSGKPASQAVIKGR